MSPDNEAKSVLETWYVVELLAYRDLTDRFSERGAQRVAPGGALRIEWESWCREAEQSSRAYSQTGGDAPSLTPLVHLREFDVGPVLHRAGIALGIDAPPEGNDHRSALGVIRLGRTGKYLEGSLSVASLPWFVAALETSAGSPAVQALSARFRAMRDDLERELLDEGVAEREMSLTDLAKLVARLEDVCPVAPDKVLDLGTVVFRKAPAEEDPDLLSSFYLEDLERTIADAMSGELPPLVAALFDFPNVAGRVDLVSDRGALRRLLEPRSFPSASWPNKNIEPALMQEAAMAAVRETERSQRRIVSVNGPPGTGKTTLLREFVADQITRRAEAMTRYARPGDAFQQVSGEHEVNPIYAPAPSIAGREIVVASSNNRAVENVSDELPAQEAVCGFEAELSQVDAFADVATAILRSRSDKSPETAAWGLIAASLGSKEKRKEFVYPFWRTKSPLPSVLRNGKAHAVNWKTACDEFGVKRARVASLIAERGAAFDAADDHGRIAVDLAAARSAALTAQQAFSDSMAAVASSKQDVAQALGERELAMSRYDDLKQRAPSLMEWASEWVSSFFGDRSVSGYSETLRTARREFATADQRAASARESMQNFEYKESQSREACEAAQRRSEGLQRQAEDVEKKLSEYRQGLELIGDGGWWSGKHEDIQDRVPLVDAELRLAQRTLFCAAMLVHRVFIAEAWNKLRPTLWNWVDLLSGASKYRDAEAVAAMWRCAFLVVPVMSTTFASVKTMFKRLPVNALGWAVIDEAGQAVPQAAIGLFRRSRHALVVGDPSQIEPVVPLERDLLFELRKLQGVRERWVADGEGGASLQTIIDELGLYGTWRDIGGERKWIGVPLFVHRRCTDPMFAISNAIAYEGRMINRTRNEQALDFLPQNAWIDERSACSAKHVVEEQITLVHDALLRLDSAREGTFVITPFKAIARALVSRLDGIIKRDRIGTIHTFQGKETDVVFLVLGLDMDSRHSRWFAYERPNVLNVAVTRAKGRLYIVGDTRVWGGGDNFGCAQQYLGAITPSEFLDSLPPIRQTVYAKVLTPKSADDHTDDAEEVERPATSCAQAQGALNE